MRKIKKIKLFVMIASCCLIFCIALILSCIKCGNNNIQKRGVEICERELTKKQIIQIASKAFEERFGLDVDKCRITYDRKNKIWNKYYAEYYPHFVDKNYQAVRLSRTGQLQIGGGPYWICIDKKTGEVLQMDVGM